ncbi:regulatory protein MarR [Solidesulfovibrio fructosivorans JJ]]|uniref:Regulatory protein MarR n=1 Tax=Solidesulfovibrio fructosivorans JJ] TaxID=596151 RepID=E1JYB5_SOLFR|nr:MarR family transcriptional regulator [Solidesulfovibrio fructosivorans]EFL50689.1 regulatory protein MarR [Solidesulfovibrio fructosivorans JJ]]
MVRVLDGLERMGLVTRRDQPADRRSKDVRLTTQLGGAGGRPRMFRK